MGMSPAEMVREFTAGSGAATPDKPELMTAAEMQFITKMIIDETLELWATMYTSDVAKAALTSIVAEAEALEQDQFTSDAKGAVDQIAAQADALIDIEYYMLNCAAKKGFNMSAIFGVVHGANMAKRNPATGQFERRADGKIIKPSGWQAPDVEGELARQVAEGAWPSSGDSAPTTPVKSASTTAECSLADAISQLSLAQPEVGVKKMVTLLKEQYPQLNANTKDVRAALTQVKAAAALASPAVSPSASPDGAATPASASAKEITEAVESSRQMKLRLQKEAIMEEKVRAKRKNAAFKKLFPDIDLHKAFGSGVDRRQQKLEVEQLKEKLSDPAYLSAAMMSNALSVDDIAELVADMKSGNFTPAAPGSDSEEEEESRGKEEEEQEAAGKKLPSFGGHFAAQAASMGLPSFGTQAEAQSGAGLPSFGGQVA